EFYYVRYSAVLRYIQLKNKVYRNILEDQTDEELIEQINDLVAIQREEYDTLYDSILMELEEQGIFFIDDTNIPEEHIDFVSNYFNSELSHSIAIYILQDNLKSPAIRDGAFYLAVKFWDKENLNYALIDLPTHIFPRFVLLPKTDDKQYVMYLEDIIRYHLDEIFKVFRYEQIEAHSIKITRDSELDFDNDLEHSLLEKVSKSLEGRRKGEPVRIVYDRAVAPDTLEFLIK